MADTDKNPFLEMFTDFGKSMNLSGPDINDVIDYHRKNLQALQAATQSGSSTAQALLSKQREMLEQTLAEISEAVQAAAKGGDAAGIASNQMELARKAFEATLQNTREMAEIVQKGNTDTLQVLKDRLMESIEELTGKK